MFPLAVRLGMVNLSIYNTKKSACRGVIGQFMVSNSGVELLGIHGYATLVWFLTPCDVLHQHLY